MSGDCSDAGAARKKQTESQSSWLKEDVSMQSTQHVMNLETPHTQYLSKPIIQLKADPACGKSQRAVIERRWVGDGRSSSVDEL